MKHSIKKTESGAPIIRRFGRTFQNDKGDWVAAEKKIKEAISYAQVVDQMAIDLEKANQKVKDLLLDAFKVTPETDCLFYDSPISPSRQVLYLKSFLVKLGFEGIRDVTTSHEDIKPFSAMIEDGCAWLMKFKNVEEK